VSAEHLLMALNPTWSRAPGLLREAQRRLLAAPMNPPAVATRVPASKASLSKRRHRHSDPEIARPFPTGCPGGTPAVLCVEPRARDRPHSRFARLPPPQPGAEESRSLGALPAVLRMKPFEKWRWPRRSAWHRTRECLLAGRCDCAPPAHQHRSRAGWRPGRRWPIGP